MDSIRQRLPASLFTERLVLTTPVLAHVPALAELANNQRIFQVLSRLPHPYRQSDGQFFVEQIARGTEEWAWSILRDGQFIGVMGLHLLPGQEPQLGYWLGEPYWGQGYATEAGQAVVAAAREAGVPALGARALLSNGGSLGVLRKLGFSEVGEAVDESGTLVGQRVMLMRLESTP